MNFYLHRYAEKESLFPSFSPNVDLEIIVVIPCYGEAEILQSLNSLNTCESIENVLIVLIVNESEASPEELKKVNRVTIEKLKNYQSKIQLLWTFKKFPHDKAGVGLARKTGMDEAVRIFEKIQKNGILVCFDADCTCSKNYFQSIKAFYEDGKKEVGLVFFEHNLNENSFEIINYEIHLRYYINALRLSQYPFSFQTLGSCITLTSKRYQKEGGMNTKKAGEDFHFLHKIAKNGRWGEINDTSVFPAARISSRVPFGTGYAIAKMKKENAEYRTYNPEIFIFLKRFIIKCDAYFVKNEGELDPISEAFLKHQHFAYYWEEMRKHSKTIQNFRKRFFTWFDGLKVLQFIHFYESKGYDKVTIEEALHWLGHTIKDVDKNKSRLENLLILRKYDRNYGVGPTIFEKDFASPRTFSK